jgi:hypothetical protein
VWPEAGAISPVLPSCSPAQETRITGSRWEQAPAELKPQIPDGVRASAKRQLDRLGIDADTALDVSFNRLIGYFRGFEAKELPKNAKGNLYRDLVDNQAGVCRHRSFAFMITATALGLPTRYVTNEAHAFVEVWFPERGWQRIDLGGAALRMEVTGADDKTLHRPRSDDPFAKPDEYKQNYTQLQGDIAGLRVPLRPQAKQAPTVTGQRASDGAPGLLRCGCCVACDRLHESAYRGIFIARQRRLRLLSPQRPSRTSAWPRRSPNRKPIRRKPTQPKRWRRRRPAPQPMPTARRASTSAFPPVTAAGSRMGCRTSCPTPSPCT